MNAVTRPAPAAGPSAATRPADTAGESSATDLGWALASANRHVDAPGDLREPATFESLAGQLLAAVGTAAPAVSWASITARNSAGAPFTLASTAPGALVLDQAQYAAGQGPCVQAMADPDVPEEPEPVVVDDVFADPRWPHLHSALHRPGTRIDRSAPSVVSRRLPLPHRQRASLNLYSDRAPGAWAGQAALMAAAVNLGLSALMHRRKADNLAAALDSNRAIGTAVGILLVRHQWTAEQAFEQMRQLSQRGHRKLRDIADYVVLTGTLPS